MEVVLAVEEGSGLEAQPSSLADELGAAISEGGRQGRSCILWRKIFKCEVGPLSPLGCQDLCY